MTETSQGPRQTLAMRLAERQRQRDLRAERLARLRTATPETATGVPPGVASGVVSGAAPEIETAFPLPLAPAALAVAAPASATLAGFGDVPQDAPEDAPEDAEAALEEFLRALTGGVTGTPAPRPEPGAVLHFQRPATEETTPAGDLDRLPGAGPGLVRALERAGFRRLADLASLEPDDLAARLGPIGRLVPAQTWIDAAKAAPPA